MIYALLVLIPDVHLFFTDQGLWPRAAAMDYSSPDRWSLLYISGELWWAAAVILFALVCAFSLLIGYRARLSAVLCWILYLSITNRNLPITQGGDALLVLLLAWSVFLPISSRWSVDAAFEREPPSATNTLMSIAAAGLLLQVIYVYFFGALLKTSPVWIPNGTAVSAAVHLDTLATDAGRALRQYTNITFILTLLVWSLELLTPFLLLFANQAIRAVTLIALIIMHLAFRLFLDIGHFWLVSIASLVVFIGPPFWTWWEKVFWRTGASKCAIVVHASEPTLFLKVAKQFLLPRQAAFAFEQNPASEPGAQWSFRDASGRQHAGQQAVKNLLDQANAFAPLRWLWECVSPTWKGMSRRIVERDSLTASPVLNENPGPAVIVLKSGRMRAFIYRVAIPSIMLLTTLSWNIVGNFNAIDTIPRLVQKVATTTAITQRWGMFAPHPLKTEVWAEVHFIVGDSISEDVISDISRKRHLLVPDVRSELFPSYRWRKYFDSTYFADATKTEEKLTHLASHWCRTLYRTQGFEKGVSIDIRFTERTVSPNQENDETRQVSFEFACRDS